jgi:hypothetical protein
MRTRGHSRQGLPQVEASWVPWSLNPSGSQSAWRACERRRRSAARRVLMATGRRPVVYGGGGLPPFDSHVLKLKGGDSRQLTGRGRRAS